MDNPTVSGIFLTIIGAIALLSAIFNWEFFFARRATSSLIGRTPTRIIYGAIGIALIVWGVIQIF